MCVTFISWKKKKKQHRNWNKRKRKTLRNKSIHPSIRFIHPCELFPCSVFFPYVACRCMAFVVALRACRLHLREGNKRKKEKEKTLQSKKQTIFSTKKDSTKEKKKRPDQESAPPFFFSLIKLLPTWRASTWAVCQWVCASATLRTFSTRFLFLFVEGKKKKKKPRKKII